MKRAAQMIMVALVIAGASGSALGKEASPAGNGTMTAPAMVTSATTTPTTAMAVTPVAVTPVAVTPVAATPVAVTPVAATATAKPTTAVNPALAAQTMEIEVMQPGIMYGYGEFWPMLPYLNVDQWKQYETLMKGYLERINPLRQEMLTQRLELDALTRAPNVAQKDLHDLASSIAALYGRMEKEVDAMGKRLRDELGVLVHPSLLWKHAKPVNLEGLVPIYPTYPNKK